MHLAILVFAIVSVYGLITSKEIVSALMRVIAGLVAALIVGRIGKMGRVVVLVSMNAAQMYLSESWKDLVL
jgi:FtsH-binding integral membrane protein